MTVVKLQPTNLKGNMYSFKNQLILAMCSQLRYVFVQNMH